MRALCVVGVLSVALVGARLDAGPQGTSQAPVVGERDEPIPGELIYPLPSKVVWQGLVALAGDLNFGIYHRDDEHQVLVTNLMTATNKVFSDVGAIDLPNGLLPTQLQFHFSVSPLHEPARVAIGTVMNASGRRQIGATVYGNGILGAWIVSKLSRQLGVGGEPLSGSAAGRAEQSRRLMPEGMLSPCSTTPSPLHRPSTPPTPGVGLPRLVHEVKPYYPGRELQARRESRVLLDGEITEHGTLVNIHHADQPGVSEDFKAMAQEAVALWRFDPGTADGCPIRTIMNIEMSFELK